MKCKECGKDVDAVAAQKFYSVCSTACARKQQLKQEKPEVDTYELNQTGRWRWHEALNGFYVNDTHTGECTGMGDGVDMFSKDDGEPIPVGSQEFYDCLREYFDREQAEIGEAYFNVIE